MLTGKSGEMKKWKSNELKFIDDNLELLKTSVARLTQSPVNSSVLTNSLKENFLQLMPMNRRREEKKGEKKKMQLRIRGRK